MKNSLKILIFIFANSFFINCKQQQQARMPISQSSGTFMAESAERNKILIKQEENKIAAIIKSNPSIKYYASKNGYWYHYVVRNETDTLCPKKGDVAFFDYEISDLNGNSIYTAQDLKPQTYLVDKQTILMGLRTGIKMMRKTEKVTFLFPSHIAYGYHGDNDKIGTNEPLMCTVTLNDFKKENK